MNLKKYHTYLPFLVFFVIMVLWHWILPINTVDDLYFRTKPLTMPLLSLDTNNFLAMRYLLWSSRTLIEMNLGILAYLPGKVWKLADSLAYTLIPILIVKLSSKKDLVLSDYKKILINSISCLFIGLFIVAFYDILGSAGWIATTINYIWPFCFALIHFYILKYYIFRFDEFSLSKKVFISIISLIALLEAISSEQLLDVVLMVYICIILYSIYKKIKLPKIIWCNILAIFLNIIYIIKSPGNHERFVVAVNTVLPEFKNLTLINKLDIGFNVFLNWCIAQADIITISFLIIFGGYIYFSLNKRKIAIIGFIPLFISILCSVLNLTGFGNLNTLMIIPEFGLLSMDFNLMIINALVNLIFIFSILIPLFLCYKDDTNNKFVINLLLLIIICIVSAMISGFTPLFNSEGRVYIYSYFILIICNILMINEIFSKK